MTARPAPAHWICPECSGPWVRNFVFDHDRATCTIGKAEDATQYADFLRLQLSWWTKERDTTEAEAQLAEVISGEPLTAGTVTTVAATAPGIMRRVIAGINPEEILEES